MQGLAGAMMALMCITGCHSMALSSVPEGRRQRGGRDRGGTGIPAIRLCPPHIRHKATPCVLRLPIILIGCSLDSSCFFSWDVPGMSDCVFGTKSPFASTALPAFSRTSREMSPIRATHFVSTYPRLPYSAVAPFSLFPSRAFHGS